MTALHERPTPAISPLDGVRVISGKADDAELAAILAVTLMEGSLEQNEEASPMPTEWIRRARLGVMGSRPSWRWSSHP